MIDVNLYCRLLSGFLLTIFPNTRRISPPNRRWEKVPTTSSWLFLLWGMYTCVGVCVHMYIRVNESFEVIMLPLLQAAAQVVD